MSEVHRWVGHVDVLAKSTSAFKIFASQMDFLLHVAWQCSQELEMLLLKCLNNIC